MKQENDTIQPDIFLTGKEMIAILEICGYMQSDFARALGKSPSYVNRVLAFDKPFLPLDDLQILQNFLGMENFTEARQQLSCGLVTKSLPKEFLHPILLICGKNNAEFSRFLKRGPSFVYDLLSRLPRNTSLPLRYIDALIAFVGRVHYDAALQETIRRQNKRLPGKK